MAISIGLTERSETRMRMCLYMPLDLATMLQFGSLDDVVVVVEPRRCYDQTKAAASLLATRHFHEIRRPDIPNILPCRSTYAHRNQTMSFVIALFVLD